MAAAVTEPATVTEEEGVKGEGAAEAEDDGVTPTVVAERSALTSVRSPQ